MAGAHLLHDDYVHSRKDSDDEAFNLKIINRLVNTLSRELSLESYWKIRNTVNESMSTQEAEVENLKQQGNACVREKKYQKAMIHYSQAIKLDPKNYSLYSNRSFTFLMLERYRDALNDALITIRLKPDWSKGYFRKGEVELKLSSYNEALESYNKALTLQPNEPKILEAMNKASKSLIKDRRDPMAWSWRWYYIRSHSCDCRLCFYKQAHFNASSTDGVINDDYSYDWLWHRKRTSLFLKTPKKVSPNRRRLSSLLARIQ
ncbi:PREDICTED: hsp70-Hsp90 organizing protein 3-like isoform X2 [Acromyrmex echinatior]|uniref:hsp70-Hsp90 organizing protein 3-like isoform X2 n=1 Tax=Acromyrmex echinatior TaxID=103372 RepID=UPI00058107F9|nr:PREDICTED: hsp70-Hsp90 organizing protein 3-like isoform X2 [Acromyrmex echinatior]